MNNQFSTNLRNLRTEHKLSQKNLAQILGIDHQTISRLERDYKFLKSSLTILNVP